MEGGGEGERREGRERGRKGKGERIGKGGEGKKGERRETEGKGNGNLASS